MTGPAPVGYPDWQRTYAGSRKVIINMQNVLQSINQVFPPVVTANTAHLGINASTQNEPLSIALFWYFDAAQSIPLAQDYLEIYPNQFFDQTVAVKGPFLVYTLGVPLGPTTITLIAYETNAPAISQHDRNGNELVALWDQSVVAHGDVTFPLKRVWAGEVSCLIWSETATTWEAWVEATNADNSLTYLHHVDNSFPKATQRLFLPPLACRVELENHDAVANNFDIFILGKPFYP